MSKDASKQSLKLKEVDLILDEMKELGKFKGIVLSYRNGGLIAQNVDNNSDLNEFAAMSASVLESAEGLRDCFGAKRLERIIAEIGNYSIIITECNSEIFITFIIENESRLESRLDRVFNNLLEFFQKIINACES